MPSAKSASRGQRVTASLLLIACATQVFAQSAVDLEELRRRSQQEEQERFRRQQAPEVRLPAPDIAVDIDAIDLPAETPCFGIGTLRLEGERLADFKNLQHHLDRYADRCIGREGISLIAKRLAARLVIDGYVTTRIGIPEQDLADGALRFTLIPGVIRAIRFANDTPAGAWQTAFPVRPGDLLNLRDIEQGLEQMKRVPSQDVDIAIEPGETPGESDLVLTVKRTRPWRIGANLDDAGAKATGKLQMGTTLSVDNPLGANDLFSATLNHDADHRAGQRGNDGWNIQYSIPWGNWTLALSESRYDYHQSVQGINQSFISSGETETQDIRLQRLLFRSQASKTSLQLRALRREQHNYLDDTEIQIQRRTTVAAEVGLQHRQYLGTAQLDLSLALRKGMPLLDGMGDAPNRTAGQPTNRYALQTLDIGLIAPFAIAGAPLRWNTAFRGQTTRDTLYASDQFALGNRYTVRGFDGETTLAAERGWYLRNEIESPLAALGLPGQALFAGLDTGRLGGPGANALIGRSLTGAVLGLRGGGYGVTYELFAGWGLKKPEGFASHSPTAGFQLAYLF